MKPMVPIMRLFADADQTREVGAPPTSARDPHRPGTHISTGPGLSRDRRHIAPVRACVEGHSCLRAQMPLPVRMHTETHAQAQGTRPRHAHANYCTSALCHPLTHSRTHIRGLQSRRSSLADTPIPHSFFFLLVFSLLPQLFSCYEPMAASSSDMWNTDVFFRPTCVLDAFLHRFRNLPRSARASSIASRASTCARAHVCAHVSVPRRAALSRAALCRAMPYRAMPRCATPCRAIPRRAVPCRAMPCCAMPCRATERCAVRCRAMPRRATPHRAMPCHAALCRAMPQRAAPCYAVPCCAAPCLCGLAVAIGGRVAVFSYALFSI